MNDIQEHTLFTETAVDEDAFLVAEAQNDLISFDKLYDKYVKDIYRYLLSRVGSTAVAEDLTSMTFLAALEMFPTYRHKGLFKAWLFSIASRKAADFFRKESKQDKYENTIDEAIFITDLIDEVIQSERQKELLALIQHFDKKDRELLRLRFVAELKFREIAVLTRRNEAAVKKSYYRLLSKLKIELENFYE